MVDIPKLKFKLVVIGGKSGKTSIIERFVKNQFPESPSPTNASKNYSVSKIYSKYSNAEITFDITDTSSNEKFNALFKILYKDQEIGILVYDLTNRDSFEEMKKKYKLLKESNQQNICIYILNYWNIVICVCGNKLDETEKIVITDAEVRKFTVENSMFFKKVSAKTGEGIEELFLELGEKLVEKELSEFPVEKDVFKKELGI